MNRNYGSLSCAPLDMRKMRLSRLTLRSQRFVGPIQVEEYGVVELESPSDVCVMCDVL